MMGMVMRRVSEQLANRSNRFDGARYQCADEEGDDNVPYELMGQVLIVTFLVTLLIFVWLAELEGV